MLRKALKRAIASAAFFAIAASTTLPAGARPPSRDYVVDPGLIVQNITGPKTIIVVGNPFRYPWSVAVNGQSTTSTPSLAQLGPTLATAVQPTTNGTNSGAPTPPPPGIGGNNAAGNTVPAQLQSQPGTLTTLNSASLPATTTNGAIVVGLLANPSLPSAGVSTCQFTNFAKISDCTAKLEKSVDTTIGPNLQTAWESVCNAQIEYLALQQRADDVLQGIDLTTQSGRNAAPAAFAALIGRDPRDPGTERLCTQLNRNVSVSGATTRPSTGRATVASTNAAIARVRSFPEGEIATEVAQLTALRAAMQTYANGLTLTNEQNLLCDKVDRSTCSQGPAVTDISKVPPIASQKILNETTRLNVIEGRLAPYLNNGPYAKAFTSAVTQLQTLRGTVLSNVTVSRFYVTIAEDCTGLFGGGRTTQITVTRDNTANSVNVVCPARSFTTVGFAFSGLAQRDFAAVEANKALPQAPPGSNPTPPPGVIIEKSFSDIRPMPVVLLNVRFSAEESADNGVYASFGVALNTGPSSASPTVDYFAGVSYSLARSLLITGGVTLAPTTILAPGFRVGDPFTSTSGSPPTTTRLRAAPFLAITYGASH